MAMSRFRPPGFLITAAAHDLRELHYAAKIGAGAVFLSPVFSTQSHPEIQTLGPLRFSALLSRCVVPAYALGGIDSVNAKRLLGTPAVGIAGISGIG